MALGLTTIMALATAIAIATTTTTTTTTTATALSTDRTVTSSSSSSSRPRSSSATLLTVGSDVFCARPFSSSSGSNDQERINELCKNVWGGTDYLPQLAQDFEADPLCDFVVLDPQTEIETESETESPGGSSSEPKTPRIPPLAAAGNRRLLPGTFNDNGKSGGIWWIEAIRVSEALRGRGIAGILTAELCRRARARTDNNNNNNNNNNDGYGGAREIMSCTVDPNRAMTAVFAKEGIEMRPVGAACGTDFGALAKLPGWSSPSSPSSDGRQSQSQPQPQSENILRALDLEDRIPPSARSRNWERVESEEELASLLETTTTTTTPLGYLPAIGKMLWPSDDLSDSLRKGLVRKLVVVPDNNNSNNNNNTNEEEENDATKQQQKKKVVVWALVRDRAVTSLRSQYVCSIAASHAEDLDAALWEACRPEYAALLDDGNDNNDEDDDNNGNKTKTKTNGNPSFSVMVNWPLSGTSATVEGIPFDTRNIFRFYRWKAVTAADAAAADDDDDDHHHHHEHVDGRGLIDPP